jgi:hypothetical protein
MKPTLINLKTTSHTTILDGLNVLRFSHGGSRSGASTRQRSQQALVTIGPTRYYHTGLGQGRRAAYTVRVPNEISTSVYVRVRRYGMLSYGGLELR